MTIDSQTRDALSRYDALMVDDSHRELTERTLQWSRQHTQSTDTDRQAKEAYLSSTFEIFCAPPAATPEENFVSMKFLLVFFRADDAPPALLDEFVPWMDGEGGQATSDLSTYYDALMHDFAEMGRDADGFRRALRGMCTAMQAEKRANKTTMGEDDYQRLRKHTVAVPAYTEC